ncbi:cadherin domain-containing protein [Microvirga sp. 2YAF29]|uniref:cadherin domain-containing protein n=1 Tax=Microvirga sp. 2YAF29 TaxID=3233031 RepID=UPI003F97CDE1
MATSVTINPISGDGYLNATEAGQSLTITGTYTGSFSSGADRIYVTIGGQEYSTLSGGGITASGGTWTLTIPANRVANLASQTVEVELQRNGGFPFGWYVADRETKALTVDKVAPTITTIDTHSVAEGQTVIGDLTVSGNSTPATLSGPDASKFKIENGKLVFVQAQNYEGGQTTFSVTVEARDVAGNVTKKDLTVNLTNVTPVITSSATWTLPENETGVSVATLVAQDPGTPASSLTFSVTGGADAALFKVEGDKLVYKGVPLDFEKPGQQKTFTVQVTASDGVGNSAPQTITINLQDVNDNAPVIDMSASYDVAENQLVVATLSAKDADTVGDKTFSVVGGADGDLFTVDPNGRLVFKQAPDFEGGKTSFEVEVKVFDGVYSTTKTITVNVTDVNDAPAAISLSASTVVENEDGAIIGNLSTTDQDAGDTFTYTVNDQRFEVVNGQLKLKAGQWINYETESKVTVQVTSTDKGGAHTTETFTIDVTDVNDVAPEITSGATWTLLEGQNDVELATLTATDLDTLSSALTYKITGGADKDLFKIENGKLVYVGGALDYDLEGQNKALKVEVTAYDDVNNESAPQVITVNLQDVNDTAPEITSGGTGALPENQNNYVVATLTSHDKDTTGETITYKIAGGADAGLFKIEGDKLVYTGGPLDFEYVNQKKSFNVTVTASDGVNTSAAQAITISLKDVNDNAPTIDMNDSYDAAENQTIVTTLIAKDDDTADAGIKTFQVSGGTDGHLFTVDENGQLVFKEVPNFEGGQTSFSVEVQLTDGIYVVKKTITVNLTDVNDAPTAISLSAHAVDENAEGAVIGNLSTTDQDVQDTFTYSVDDERFEVVNGQLKLKAGVSLDYEDASSVDVTVTSEDFGGLTTTKTFTINVADKNDAPTEITLSAANVDENEAGAVIGTLSTTDQDADETFTYTVNDNRFEVVNGQLKLKAGVSLDFEAASSIDVTVTSEDFGGLTTTKTFTINVADKNDAPTEITLSAATVAENAAGAEIGTLSTTDQDADETFAYAVDDQRFVVVDGKLKLKDGVSLDFEDKSSIDVIVTSTDSKGAFTAETFTIEVTDKNDAPTAVSLSSHAVNENAAGAIIGTLSTTDQDAEDSFTYTVNDNRFEVVNGQLKLKAGIHLDTEKESAVNLTVTSKDAGGLTTAETFTIDVLDQNDNAPVLKTTEVNLNENVNGFGGGALIADLQADDPDTVGGPITFTLLNGADSDLFTVENGKLYYVGAPIDYEKADRTDFSVKVSVTDGTYTTSSTIKITLKDVNDNAPLFETKASYDVNENQSFVADLAAAVNDQGMDPDDIYTFQVKGKDAALFDVVDGKLVFKAAPDYEAGKTSFEVEVEVWDGKYTVSKQITINLKDVNEAPTAIGLNKELAALTTAENGAAMKVTDITVTDDALGTNTLSLVGDDADMFEIRGTELWFKGNADYEAQRSYSVAVQVTDEDDNAITSDVITVDVTDENDTAPEVSVKVYDLDENATNAVVADLSSLDPDTVGLNPAQFSISGELAGIFEINEDNQLVYVGIPLDFEKLDEKEGELQVTAFDGVNTTTTTIKIRIRDVNEAPTAIALSASTVAENAAGAVIGNLTTTDQDEGDSFTYTVSDSRFEVVNGQLKLKAGVSLDFEAASKINVTVTAKDAGDLTTEETFTINVTDVNDTPSKVLVSGGSVLENSAKGTVVGTLSALDQDAGDTFRFDLLSNADGRFTLDGNRILVADSLKLDYEQATSHQVIVRVTDKAGAIHDEVLTLGVGDVLVENVAGSASADRIYGGAGNDRISSGNGNDFIDAGAGRDKIDGGRGNDRIIGGAGQDTMTGGAGRDVFVFNEKDTGTTRGRADYITDFSGSAGDRLDLRAIDANTTRKGNQNFSFIGNDDFTKAGQVRYEKAGNYTYVYFNTDNDKAAEGVIKLKGALDLQKSWFVL